MSKKCCFRGCFHKQYGKFAKALLKSGLQHLDHNDLSLVRILCSKKSLVLTCQILGLLVNTLAADEKYPVVNREKLTIPTEIQLSQKQKPFSKISVPFLKSILNFKYVQLKADPHRFGIFEVTDTKNVVR